jgi:tRNA 2-selenouridine synthase
MDQRVRLLLEEYGHFLAAPEALFAQLSRLSGLRGQETIERWTELIRQGRWPDFVRDMLENHYDPAYRKSLGKNYADSAASQKWHLAGTGWDDFAQLADALLEKIG